MRLVRKYFEIEINYHTLLMWSTQKDHKVHKLRRSRLNIQWDHCNTDTLGPLKCVLIREVS